ncbi:MAG TPA: pitrilysin family protein [Gemmatimonadaceae bacterium]|nr:pitrilysin family protein [Gemmatimonadaceae bacterium]
MDRKSIHRTILPNGLTVLIQEEHSAPVVAIVTYVKAGYFDETDDQNGLAHALEHMFFKGTKKRGVGDIAKETKASGGYLNAHTIYDNTTYYTVLPASGFAAGLDIQADAYANSVIDAAELAREMEVIIQEAKRKSDNPSAIATETLYELLHDAHRMRRWRIGREEGLRAFTREKMNGFYRKFYKPSNTILSISGDVDPDKALELVTKLYGPLAPGDIERSRGPVEPDRHQFRYRELSGDIAQSQLVIGWNTPGTLDADTPVLDVAASVLGTGRASRLYRAVREKKLASSVSAYDYTPTDLGVFVVHAETEPELTPVAARVIWDQVRQLREHRVEDDELQRVKRIFESRWVRRLETAEGRANYLAEWEALGGWHLGQDYFDQFLSVTATDVQQVTHRYLDPDKAAVLVYRPEKTPAIASDAIAMREVLDAPAVEKLPSIPPHPAPPPPRTKRAKLEREEQGVSVFRTVAGIPILVRRKSGTPMASVGVYFVGGAVEEPADLAGLTLLTARTSVKGTASRTAAQIAEDSEMLGGSISASAGSDSFGWSFSVPTARYAEAVALLGDVIQRPVFPADSLETERSVAISNVSMLRDDMYRYPTRLANSLAFHRHPYGVPTMGTESSLQAISLQQVADWHRAHVLSGAAVVGVVSDIDPQEAADVIAGELAQITPAPPPVVAEPRWPDATETAAESRDKAQTAMAMAFPSPSRSNDQRFAASLIATVASGLGGRFFDELREKQSLAYTVHAGASVRRVGGLFLSYIATSPEKEEVARAGLLAEFAKLRAEPVTAEELSRAKEYVVGSHAISQESGGSLLAEMLDAWMFGAGLHELAEHDTRVRAVTAEEMRAVAEEYFNPERRVEGIIRGVGRTLETTERV